MSSKTYLIAWDGAIDNCLNIQNQLHDSGLEYVFYNVSSVDVESPKWVRSEDLRYYGHFYNALKDFCNTTHGIFIFNAGDPVYDRYVELTTYLEDIFFKDDGVGLYAPGFDYDSFNGPASFLEHSKRYPELNLATHTNGIYLAMSRDLALFMKDFLDWGVSGGRFDLRGMKSGWGLDTCYNSLAVYWNKRIYRDAELTMHHPAGSSYDNTAAFAEMNLIRREFGNFCESRSINSNKIHAIGNMMHRKSHDREAYPLTIDELYLNLEGPLEA
jgi:hypothetical protein